MGMYDKPYDPADNVAIGKPYIAPMLNRQWDIGVHRLPYVDPLKYVTQARVLPDNLVCGRGDYFTPTYSKQCPTKLLKSKWNMDTITGEGGGTKAGQFTNNFNNDRRGAPRQGVNIGQDLSIFKNNTD